MGTTCQGAKPAAIRGDTQRASFAPVSFFSSCYFQNHALYGRFRMAAVQNRFPFLKGVA
jgi:hypothetical protein